MMTVVTLELVGRYFEQWRSQRANRAEPIPEKLWSMATGLYPQYKRSHICRYLGLSGSHFKQRIEVETGDLSDCGFVLAAHDVDFADSNSTTEVALSIEGQRRTLTLKVNIDALTQVLPHVEALL